MHFFNPVPVMALVELVAGLQTSDETRRIVAAPWPNRSARLRSMCATVRASWSIECCAR